MDAYSIITDIRWSDLDPNFHVLHSRYYDFGAYCRMKFLVEHGITPAFLKENSIGPILFHEECFFRKELVFGDVLTITLRLSKMTEDFRKWSMVHEIFKGGNILAATMNVDAAWMDTTLRKITSPPVFITKIFEASPKTIDFQLTNR
jgi:acyl-CoA thioester hydrolase